MKCEVKYSKKAVRQIKKLDEYTQIMLLNWISKNLVNCANPFEHGKALDGDLKNLWRYRIGDYRIITKIYDDSLVILVLTVGHRRDVYSR